MNDYYLFCETAFHHEGDVDYLKDLVRASKEAGADAVKFQVLTSLESFASRQHTSYKLLESCLIAGEDWLSVFNLANELGLDIMIMPLDEGVFDLIKDVDIKYLEIHSVSFFDELLLSSIKQSKIPVVLGVGGRTKEEIDEKVDFFDGQVEILMFGFQAFPTMLADLRMKKIPSYIKTYPNLRIGYADHSKFDDPFAVQSNDYAYLLGSRIFEKHITFDEGEQRVDYESAVSPAKIREIRSRLDFLSSMLKEDDDLSSFSTPEEIYRQRQKVLVASKQIPKGTILTRDDLDQKILNQSDGIFRFEEAIGKTTNSTIDKDAIISSNCFLK